MKKKHVNRLYLLFGDMVLALFGLGLSEVLKGLRIEVPDSDEELMPLRKPKANRAVARLKA